MIKLDVSQVVKANRAMWALHNASRRARMCKDMAAVSRYKKRIDRLNTKDYFALP